MLVHSATGTGTNEVSSWEVINTSQSVYDETVVRDLLWCEVDKGGESAFKVVLNTPRPEGNGLRSDYSTKLESSLGGKNKCELMTGDLSLDSVLSCPELLRRSDVREVAEVEGPDDV